jgi:hypothetical protein
MTAPTSELWVTESKPGRQAALSWLMLAASLFLMYAFRGFQGPSQSNSLAGFALGALLMLIAAASLLSGGKQTISVDSRRRQIVISGPRRFGSSKGRVILFKDVAQVRVGRFGKASSASQSFYVSLILKQGGSVPLFFGFFEGQYDRNVAQARCDRLAAYLQL